MLSWVCVKVHTNARIVIQTWEGYHKRLGTSVILKFMSKTIAVEIRCVGIDGINIGTVGIVV